MKAIEARLVKLEQAAAPKQSGLAVRFAYLPLGATEEEAKAIEAEARRGAPANTLLIMVELMGGDDAASAGAAPTGAARPEGARQAPRQCSP